MAQRKYKPRTKRCRVCGKMPSDRKTEAAELLALLFTSPGGFA